MIFKTLVLFMLLFIAGALKEIDDHLEEICGEKRQLNNILKMYRKAGKK